MKLVIGSANFLNKYSYKNSFVKKRQIIQILKFANFNKLKSIDTAFEYDKFYKLNDKISLSKFKISTKINFDKNKIKSKFFNKNYTELLKKKIKLFRIKKFENLFIHNFDNLSIKDLKKIESLLIFLKKKKYINKIGISIYDIKSLNKLKDFNCVNIVQAPINLIDRRFVTKKILRFLYKKKIYLQARSIFLQGLLLENIKKINELKITEKNLFKNYHLWLKKNKVTNLEACINFIKNQTHLHSFVIGVESLDQIKQIVTIFKKKNKSYPKNLYSLNKMLIDPRIWKK